MRLPFQEIHLGTSDIHSGAAICSNGGLRKTVEVLMELIRPIRDGSLPRDAIEAVFGVSREPVLGVRQAVDAILLFRRLRGFLPGQCFQDVKAWDQFEGGANEFSAFKVGEHKVG